MQSVKLSKVIEKMGLKNLTPDIDAGGIRITQPDINRPALQLTGFFDHFDTDRIQIIGYVEAAYLENLDLERKIKIYIWNREACNKRLLEREKRKTLLQDISAFFSSSRFTRSGMEIL